MTIDIMDFDKIWNYLLHQEELIHFEKRIPYCHPLPQAQYITMQENGLIYGILQMETINNTDLSLVYICVDKSVRRQGIGTCLVNEFFKYADSHNLTPVSTQFTPDGEKYIKPLFEALESARTLSLSL